MQDKMMDTWMSTHHYKGLLLQIRYAGQKNGTVTHLKQTCTVQGKERQRHGQQNKTKNKHKAITAHADFNSFFMQSVKQQSLPLIRYL